MRSLLANAAEPLATLVYPSACLVCAAPADSGATLCDDCAARAPKLRAPFCERCSEAFTGAMQQEFTCANCANRELHFEAAVSAYRSRGIVRKIVHEFKYNRQRHLRHLIGDWLVAALDDLRLRGRHFDLLVPVPLHPTRQRERGFNQAQLLAETLSAHVGIRLREPLRRIGYTTTQTAYDRAERIENLRGAFQVRGGESVRGLRVLLIDDVLTTGSTLSECARVLKRAGAISVYAATAARA